MDNKPGYSLPLLPPLQAQRGVTALAGEVRTLSDQPLEDVTLRIADQTARTDSTGRFLFTSLSPGHHILLIDGRTASIRGRTYGVFEVSLDVKRGRTNVLPFTIWMPEIDMANALSIPSPTADEVVVTNPNIPGLELHLPPGTIIRDKDGQVVTQVSITLIPVDRPPFPLPFGAEFPMYFTVQPGGAYIEPYGARLIYPNITNEPPGSRINFWHYDPEAKDWHIYGKGTVTADRKQVVPDVGLAISLLTGASIKPYGDAPKPGGGSSGGTGGGGNGSPNPNGGDPVDLSTGLFVYEHTDLFLPDVLPIALTRTQRQGSLLQGVMPFGVGSGHLYEWVLFFDEQNQEADLMLSEGGLVHYSRISPGTAESNPVFEHTSTPSVFFGSTVRKDENHWELTRKDGTVYEFSDRPVALLLSIRDRYGNTITVLREDGEHGKAIQLISPNGRWLRFTLDQLNHRIVEAKDNIGRVVTYTYAEQTQRNELRKVTDAAGGVTEYTYDTFSGIRTIKNARGIVFLTNEYDDKPRVIKQTLADGSTYKFAYTEDGDGNIIQTVVTDPLGVIRRVTFNSDGYILSDTAAVGTSDEQTFTYERQLDTNLVSSVTDPLGRKTAYTYDAMGNVKSVTRLAETAEAVTALFTYEAKFGQLTSVTDLLGHTITFDYDGQGNLITITDALGNSMTLAHNPEGQSVSVTDALGHVVQLTYDLGIQSGMTDSLGAFTTRHIDDAGRVIILTDPLGRSIKHAYDAHNNLIRVTDPRGEVTAFAYDPNRNLLSATDARGSVTKYSYDDMDRPVSRTDPLGRSESYDYDSMGNRTRFKDRNGHVTTFAYDVLNRLSERKYADGSVTNYRYDAANRLTAVEDSVSGTVTLSYDNMDRLTEVSTIQGTLTYTYDVGGRRTTMTVKGQQPVTYSYDDVNRLTKITQGTFSVAIEYNAVHKPTRLTMPNDVIVEYGYNALSQLTSIIYKQGGSLLGDLVYDYDAVGNRTKVGGSFARTDVPDGVSSLLYDAANQLRQREATSLIYDDNGNLTSDGVLSYVWNARNQLASVNGSAIAADFMYDAFGRRVRKTINGTSAEFLYDSLNVVQELSGGTPTANMLTSLGIDEYFIRTDANGSHILLFDALGSTLALLDSNGVQTRYTYEPFGATTATGTASTNPFQYTRRENDATGLYYCRARYYSPTLQRFISEDPLVFADINLYAYAAGSPVNFKDALGLVIGEALTIWDCKRRIAETWERLRDKMGRHKPGSPESIENTVEEVNRSNWNMLECLTPIPFIMGAVAGYG